MCGIVGLVDLAALRRVAGGAAPGGGGTAAGAGSTGIATVDAMCERIAHRGPDDHGVEAFGAVVLGARRLSILDLSAAGHMPMHDAQGRWVIVYNGELYNAPELRRELAALGHRFRSGSDTEVVLETFSAWGRDALERLNGMFAFAILDRAEQILTLVRDRFGIKPLYYAIDGDRLLFGSEIKAILVALGTTRVNQWQLLEWFLYRNADGLKRETLIDGVAAVAPGEALVVQRGELTSHRWHDVVRDVDEERYRAFDSMGPKAVVDGVGRLLEEAVERQLSSDVPVGLLLSGGLDSSLITAIAARRHPGLTTFHVSVKEAPALDELPFARELARRLDLPIVVHELTAAGFRRTLPRVIQFADFPLTHANAVAYQMISAVARQHGVPVLLSGEGADEVFGGYPWAHRRTLWLQRLLPIWDRLPRRFHELAELMVYAHQRMPINSYQFRELLPPTINVLDHFARNDWRNRCLDAYAFVPRVGERAVMARMLYDLEDFLAPLLLRLDRASMGASVEARVPFLDHHLVDAGLNLPIRYRIGRHADKWVLKQIAERYLPNEITQRRKLGFPTPLADYLRPLARPAFFAGGFCENELGLSHVGIEALLQSLDRSVSFVFGLVTLEIWGRLFIRGQPVEAIDERIAAMERQLEPAPS